jgi:NAD(P)-dependent dehydrogenase (short-subunit alcohol dehydrogenase family)
VTTALVTGGNRGIGLEVCRQLAAAGVEVRLGSRDHHRGEQVAAALRREGLPVRAVQLDVTDAGSVDRAVASLDALDVLVNNAASDYDSDQQALTADLRRVRRALETNLFGAWLLLQRCRPLLAASPAGRVVNVSSGAGSLAEMGGGTPGYAVSKAALNALTRMAAAELSGAGVLVNSVCPGWVATDMGGSGGRPVADGAAGVVWASTLPAGGPTGGFFRDGERIPW